MTGLLLFVAVVLGIGIIPVGLRGRYDTDGARLWLIIGPIRLLLYPKQKKRSNASDQADFSSQKKQTRYNSGNLSDFWQLLQIILDFFSDFHKKLRISNLELKMLLGSNDPCDLSIQYGRAWAILGNIMPLLEQTFRIKRRNLEVACDYTSANTLVVARIDITLSVGCAIHLACKYGIIALRQYFKILNSKKAVR